MSRQAEAVWDPAQYGVYGDERFRPFRELVERLGDVAPRHVTDLGCGSGEPAATLAGRWPDAVVEALDSSPEMIDAARAREIPGRLTFRVQDLRTWDGHDTDLIVSNAVLQWVPEHLGLLPRWTTALTPGGRLAFQVPGNFAAPSHAILRELCRSERWAGRLGHIVRDAPVLSAEGYLDLLAAHGCDVDAWETTYMQTLTGDDPVLEWVKGTALRPVLTALDPPDADAFVAQYRERLRDAYPARPHGTVYPFRRIFVIARRT
ncbi:trans-aconitate methyltransferase [Actinomadura sp. CNU-125]|uniref:trans-aconitate 2-methyltransferase n=1 Tax=Actinomadura sp. CNU-125 TaxID=1904961 RepID=UPI0009690413|nr:trans-aconitate 2-methyltransferase [Actinomadura sp. CNU-125]OLT34507.1 trans-aconitate methyltransferase [Actinomadura sp. CNU-125]